MSNFWNDLKYFTEDEFRCACCGASEMKMSFMLGLDELRRFAGFPLVVSSGYRCPDHNDAVSSTGRNGPHTTGEAADIRIYGEQALTLLMHVHRVGITGVGISQASKTAHNARFMHLDTLPPGDGRPRPWLWSY